MLNNRIALITGANKGIGLEVARQLGEHGVTVIVGARNEERGRAAARRLGDTGADAAYLRLDVTDLSSVAHAADWIDREHGRLDILVNNAGIAGRPTASASAVTAADLREVYETNVFGVVSVTRALLPLLRRSLAGRIVNMSSHVGSLTLCASPGSPMSRLGLLAYQSSKTALNAITLAYANELRDTPIKVNAACPGIVATDLNNYQGTRTPAEAAASVVKLALLDDTGPTGASLADDGVVPW